MLNREHRAPRVRRGLVRLDQGPQPPSPVHPSVQLQRAIGNRAMAAIVRASSARADRAAGRGELSVGRAGDRLEQEAERIAGRAALSLTPDAAGAATGREAQPPVVREHDANSAAATPAPAPPVVHRALNQPGRPIDEPTRASMEGLLGRDLRDVRVHTDDAAARSAEAVDARAYAVGQEIVFGRGEYAPQSAAGRRLLAHELTHAAQHGAGAPARVLRRAPATKKKTVFYQEVLDALAGHERADFIDIGGGFLRKVRDLAEAVDAEDREAIKEALDTLAVEDPPNLAPYVGYDFTYREMVSRLISMGLPAESDRLAAWYLRRKKAEASTYQPPDWAYSEHFYLWDTVVENAVAKVPASGADAADSALVGLVRVVPALRRQQAALDPKELAEDRKRQKSISIAADPIMIGTSHTISTFYGHLNELAVQAFVAFQTGFQVLQEQALSDLGAGKPSAWLGVLQARLTAMDKALREPDSVPNVLGQDVTITKSEGKKGGGRYLDYFLQGKQARRRSIGFEYYDRDALDIAPEEKSFTIERVIFTRQKQIEFLERLYGQARDQKGALTAEAKENQAIIADDLKGRMRLHSDDDWRKFLLAKFNAEEKLVGREKALTETIAFLQMYLQVFTTHSPHNIEDFGDNYLTRTFPRAMTGQLIHDCGVYALRIVYILSLLRDALKLTIRYVRFPLHIGLIITGENLPAFVAHNDTLRPLPAQTVQELQTEWRGKTEEGEPRDKPAPLDEKQFWGEVGAHEFIPNVDMPFRVLDVPGTAGTPASAKARLWQDYVKRVTRQELFGPQVSRSDSEVYQFDLRYLDVIRHQKLLHNNYFVPFWNIIAPKIWAKHAPAIHEALKKKQAAGTKDQQAAEAAYQAAVDAYLKEIEKAAEPVKRAIVDVTEAEMKLNTDLKAHPEVLAKGSLLARSARFVFPTWLEQELFDHEMNLKNGVKIVPPFADPKNIVWRVG